MGKMLKDPCCHFCSAFSVLLMLTGEHTNVYNELACFLGSSLGNSLSLSHVAMARLLVHCTADIL